MKINGYRCDHCGKEHLIGRFCEPYGLFEPPKGWYIVSTAEGRDVQSEPLLFCSLNHLNQWSSKQLAEAEASRRESRNREILAMREKIEAFVAHEAKGFNEAYPELTVNLNCAIDASLEKNP